MVADRKESDDNFTVKPNMTIISTSDNCTVQELLVLKLYYNQMILYNKQIFRLNRSALLDFMVFCYVFCLWLGIIITF